MGDPEVDPLYLRQRLQEQGRRLGGQRRCGPNVGVVCAGSSGIAPLMPRRNAHGDYFANVRPNRVCPRERFEVVTHNNSAKNVYIERALLNGEEYGKCYIDFDEIKKGGKLELFMTDTPCKTWGTESADRE